MISLFKLKFNQPIAIAYNFMNHKSITFYKYFFFKNMTESMGIARFKTTPFTVSSKTIADSVLNFNYPKLLATAYP